MKIDKEKFNNLSDEKKMGLIKLYLGQATPQWHNKS